MKSQNPPKPPVVDQLTQILIGLTPGPRRVLLGGLIFCFLMAASTTLLLAYMVYQPQIIAWLQGSDSTHNSNQVSQAMIPTRVLTPVPTPQCIRPTLTLGPYIYNLDVTIVDQADGIPTISEPVGTAWWWSGTFSPFVFTYIPAVTNLDLKNALSVGEPMMVQWADCGREEFIFTDLDQLPTNIQELLAQNEPGIVVIIQAVGDKQGYIIHGQRPELINLPTPEPTQENAILVDITFGNTSISADGKTLIAQLAVTNRGSQSITLTNDDLSLTAEGQVPVSPLEVQPALPQGIQPGASLPLMITFANPGGNTAVFKFLDITMDLYY
jgi:hypothetical protein